MMSDTRSQSVGFDAYLDHQKGFGSFDFFINSYEPDAPQPEQFDSELDSIAGLDSAVIAGIGSVFTIPAFYINNSNNNTPSVFTSSSDSAYDTASTLSESFGNHPKSPYPASTFSFADFDMELGQVQPRAGSDYAGSSLNSIDSTTDPTSFGTLPPTPPRSPINCVNKGYDGSYANPGCFSNYPAGGNAVTADPFFPLDYGVANLNHPTVSPLNVSAGPAADMDENKMDPRRKHKCPKCPRGQTFALFLLT